MWIKIVIKIDIYIWINLWIFFCVRDFIVVFLNFLEFFFDVWILMEIDLVWRLMISFNRLMMVVIFIGLV